MSKLIKKIIILTMISGCLASCSDNKNTVTTPDSADDTYQSQFIGSMADLKYDIKKTDFDLVFKVNSYNGKLIFNSNSYTKDQGQYISVYNTVTGQTEKTELGSDVFNSYENNTVTDIKIYNDTVFYSVRSEYNDSNGKMKNDSFIGYYDLKTHNNDVVLISNEIIEHISIDFHNERIVFCTDSADICSVDMSLNIISQKNIDSYMRTSGSDGIRDMVTDCDGNIYLCMIDYNNDSEYIMKFNSEFSNDWVITEDKLNEFTGLIGIGMLRDDSFIIYSYDYDSDSYFLNVIDKETSEVLKRSEIAANGRELVSNVSYDSDLVFMSEERTELYNLEDDSICGSVKYGNDDYFNNRFVISKDNLYSVSVPCKKQSVMAYIMNDSGEITDTFEISGVPFGDQYVYDLSGGYYSKSFTSSSVLLNNKDGIHDMGVDFSQGLNLKGAAGHYLFNFGDYFEMYSQDGSCVSTFCLEMSDFLTISDKSGSEEVYYTDTEGKLIAYDVVSEKKRIIEPVSRLGAEDKEIYYDGGVHDFYIRYQEKLYAYDIGKTELIEIVSDVRRIGIDNIIDLIIINDEGTMACTDLESVYIIKPCHSETKEKTIKVAYIDDNNSGINKYASEFNKFSNEYKIVTEKLSDFSELDMKISKGEIPDILITDGKLSVKKYAEMNMFADLKSVISSDSEFDINDYFTGLLFMYEKNNAVYRIFPSFSINTLSSSSDFPEDINNPEDFYSYLSDNNISLLHSCEDKTDLCMEFMPYYIYDHIDKDTGKIDFDTDELRKLISLIEISGEKTNVFSDTDFVSDRPFVTQTRYLSLISAAKDVLQSGRDIRIVGYPGKNGPYSAVVPEICFSISENCSSKSTAWEFIKICFQGCDSGISVNKNKYRDDESEVTASDPNVRRVIDNIGEIVRTSGTAFESDNYISSVISEEFQKYYEGTESADKVISSVQARINIYINESH